jgi:hypothetical protein
MTNNVQTPGGNTTTAGAVEQLAMARRIYAQFIIDNVPGAGPDDVPQFDDNAHGVKIALAAIIETSEAAARLIDHQTPPPAGGPLSHTNSMRVVMIDAARSLRNNDHLKGPQP